MLRRGRRARAVALVWAVLQVALPTLGGLAEAAFATSASAADAHGHVEERSGPGCRPVHPPDCARCQALTTHAAAPSAPAVDWGTISAGAVPTREGAGRRSTPCPTLPLSRAPPLLA